MANVMDMHTLLVGAEEENQNRSELLNVALGIRAVHHRSQKKTSKPTT